MKINEANAAASSAAGLAGTRRAEDADVASKKGTDTRAGTDRVQVSELSQRLLNALSSESPERAARIDRLAEEFRAGRYQVDALQLSRSIIGSAFEEQ